MMSLKMYIRNSIIPIFPDAKDIPGKRVIININSGPGQTSIKFLTKLRNLGLLLYSGVTNTTSVSQETYQNYGPFKIIFRKNLYALTASHIDQINSSNIPPWIFGLIVFGRKDPVSECILEDAFAKTFSKEICKDAWSKVGAAPLTRK